ncbi:MEDS domain-containing protein [Nitrosopumilus sp.]|uniref:MEDS domain-containing protein n=1 Tax=Nitrosopumilus sp. TaxID=2024843 RepID=UPI003D0A6F92
MLNHNHPVLFYTSKNVLYEKIIEFLSEGIRNNKRCIFLTSQPDESKVFDDLKKLHDHAKIIKYFSYFFMPDPVDCPIQFENKIDKINKQVFEKNFNGYVAFNVQGNVSRFTSDSLAKIEKIENFLHSISNDDVKLLCTQNVSEKNESCRDMMSMALKTHDCAIYENTDGSILTQHLR